jgi:hypothetical protein
MYNGGNNVRAYRPSHCAAHNDTDELDQEIEKARRANVIRYAARVSAGLSIFGNSGSDSQEDLGSIAI